MSRDIQCFGLVVRMSCPRLGEFCRVHGMIRAILFMALLLAVADRAFADRILCNQTASDDQPKERRMMDRILHPDTTLKSSYNNKIFNPLGSVKMKEYNTKEYAGIKEFSSKSFMTKSFDGMKKNWSGLLKYADLFSHKKTSKDYQVKNFDATKSFPSRNVKTGSYPGLDKKSSYSTQDSYSTREFIEKGKTQGAIDNNEKLQQSIKKGLSIDEVRNLLNKTP